MVQPLIDVAFNLSLVVACTGQSLVCLSMKLLAVPSHVTAGAGNYNGVGGDYNNGDGWDGGRGFGGRGRGRGRGRGFRGRMRGYGGGDMQQEAGGYYDYGDSEMAVQGRGKLLR